VKKAYPASGILSKSTKKSSSGSPDYYGSIEIDEALMDYLAFKFKDGETRPRLELSGWRKEGNNGPFISLSPQIPYKERQESQGQSKQDSRPKPRLGYGRTVDIGDFD
jgi:hypothetical protein